MASTVDKLRWPKARSIDLVSVLLHLGIARKFQINDAQLLNRPELATMIIRAELECLTWKECHTLR